MMCVTREVLTFESLDLVTLVLNEIGSRIGLDFANCLKKETDAGGGVCMPDSGRLEDVMVVVRKQRSSDKQT